MSSAVTLEVDLHVHSDASYDGHEPIELLLEHAADIDLDAIVITDHDVIHASVDAAEMAAEYGLIGIPGVEISTAQGHLLGIGIDELPPIGRPIDETIDEVRDRGGVAVVPIRSSGPVTASENETSSASTPTPSRRTIRGSLPDTGTGELASMPADTDIPVSAAAMPIRC